MLRKLAAFDFDHTVINDNTDTAVITLIDKNEIPEETKRLYRRDSWTAYMEAIFKLLHKNGIREGHIKNLIENLPAVDGMRELFAYMNESDYDVIIISDSNSYFINTWLNKNNFQVAKVFTNPAEFLDGLLTIQMFHLQDYCTLSTKNLCKGQILDDFLREQTQNGVIYERIIYCGDGANDFCPMLRLNSINDLACVRDDYKCLDLVNKNRNRLKSQILVWKNAFEILEKLKTFI